MIFGGHNLKDSALDSGEKGTSNNKADSFSMDELAQDIAQKPIAFDRHDQKENSHSATPSLGRITPRNEESAFRALDPTLAQLHKDLIREQALYEQTMREYGAEDPMLDVIADQLDSARSAYETRLLELKSERGMAAKGLSLYRSPQEDYHKNKLKKEREERLEKEREAWAHWYRCVVGCPKKDQNNIILWLIALFELSRQKDRRLQAAQNRI
jgi:hypothetical protein